MQNRKGNQYGIFVKLNWCQCIRTSQNQHFALKLLNKSINSLQCGFNFFRCIMKWMEIKETCPICQRNCRHENENAGGGERTPLLTNPLDIWVVLTWQQRVLHSLSIKEHIRNGLTDQLSRVCWLKSYWLWYKHVCGWKRKILYLRLWI